MRLIDYLRRSLNRKKVITSKVQFELKQGTPNGCPHLIESEGTYPDGRKYCKDCGAEEIE